MSRIEYTWLVKPASFEKQVAVIVCDAFRCSYEDVLSSDKRRNVFYARATIAYVFRKYFCETLVQIGERLNRDHSSITWSIQRIEELIIVNEGRFVEKLRGIEQRLGNEIFYDDAA